MTVNLSRRRVLGGVLGASAILGAGLAGQAPRAAAAEVAGNAGAGACPDPVIPVVPGMSGDPRANQLWYELDQTTFYQPSQEFTQALAAVGAALGNPDVETAAALLYVNTQKAGTYPEAFISTFAPVRKQLEVFSAVQISVYDTYYGCDRRGLVSAMADFGQGILYDPRRPVGAKVHMMDTDNGNPPIGYHAWHAYNRAFAFLGISAAYWNRFDPVAMYGWAVASTAKPVTDAHNPPLPKAQLRALAHQYLDMSPSQIDQAFTNYPYPPGIG
jgi:hypothetical protein